jgi:hypothetical protein
LAQIEEQIYKRCEEILTKDEVLKEINSRVLLLEDRFIKCLNSTLLKMYLEIDALVMEQKEHEGVLLYLQGMKEGSEA